MKRCIFLMLIAMFVCVSFAAAQCCADKKCADKEALVQLITAQEKAVWEAYKSKDAKALGNLLAEQSYEVDEEGAVLDKNEQLQSLQDLTITAYQMKDVKVIPVAPTVAVIRYQLQVAGTYKGEALDSKWAVVSSMWVKCEGKWLNIVYQQTPIKEESK